MKKSPVRQMDSHFVTHMHAFARFLRQRRFSIGSYEVMEALRALEKINLSDRDEFRFALRLVFCSNPEQWEVFDALFDDFFRSLTGKEPVQKGKNLFDFAKESHHAALKSRVEEVERLTDDIDNQESKERNKTLGTFRFSSLSGADRPVTLRIPSHGLDEMIGAAQMLVSRIRLSRSRRWQPDKHGHRLDFRRTFRNGIQTGGDWAELFWRGHPLRKAEFVLLCDGSRSMNKFAEIILQYAFALTRCTSRVEVFLFSTGIKRVTAQLLGNSTSGLPELHVQGTEWGGGTRIGESLSTFVHQYGTKMLSANTVILIASDGLDTGSIDKLKIAMRSLRRQTASIIWLNPLKSIPGYEPKAQGMKAALPFIDTFTAATDAASFRHMAKTLKLRR